MDEVKPFGGDGEGVIVAAISVLSFNKGLDKTAMTLSRCIRGIELGTTSEKAILAFFHTMAVKFITNEHIDDIWEEGGTNDRGVRRYSQRPTFDWTHHTNMVHLERMEEFENMKFLVIVGNRHCECILVLYIPLLKHADRNPTEFPRWCMDYVHRFGTYEQFKQICFHYLDDAMFTMPWWEQPMDLPEPGTVSFFNSNYRPPPDTSRTIFGGSMYQLQNEDDWEVANLTRVHSGSKDSGFADIGGESAVESSAPSPYADYESYPQYQLWESNRARADNLDPTIKRIWEDYAVGDYSTWALRLYRAYDGGRTSIGDERVQSHYVDPSSNQNYGQSSRERNNVRRPEDWMCPGSDRARPPGVPDSEDENQPDFEEYHYLEGSDITFRRARNSNVWNMVDGSDPSPRELSEAWRCPGSNYRKPPDAPEDASSTSCQRDLRVNSDIEGQNVEQYSMLGSQFAAYQVGNSSEDQADHWYLSGSGSDPWQAENFLADSSELENQLIRTNSIANLSDISENDTEAEESDSEKYESDSDVSCSESDIGSDVESNYGANDEASNSDCRDYETDDSDNELSDVVSVASEVANPTTNNSVESVDIMANLNETLHRARSNESLDSVESNELSSNGFLSDEELNGLFNGVESIGWVCRAEPNGSFDNEESNPWHNYTESVRLFNNMEPNRLLHNVESNEWLISAESIGSLNNVEPNGLLGNVESNGSFGNVESNSLLSNLETNGWPNFAESYRSLDSAELNGLLDNLEPNGWLSRALSSGIGNNVDLIEPNTNQTGDLFASGENQEIFDLGRAMSGLQLFNVEYDARDVTEQPIFDFAGFRSADLDYDMTGQLGSDIINAIANITISDRPPETREISNSANELVNGDTNEPNRISELHSNILQMFSWQLTGLSDDISCAFIDNLLGTYSNDGFLQYSNYEMPSTHSSSLNYHPFEGVGNGNVFYNWLNENLWSRRRLTFSSSGDWEGYREVKPILRKVQVVTEPPTIVEEGPYHFKPIEPAPLEVKMDAYPHFQWGSEGWYIGGDRFATFKHPLETKSLSSSSTFQPKFKVKQMEQDTQTDLLSIGDSCTVNEALQLPCMCPTCFEMHDNFFVCRSNLYYNFGT